MSREAIEKVPFAKPNVVLLDFGLPDMSSVDMARAIKKNRVTVEIAILACSNRGCLRGVLLPSFPR